MTVRTKKVRSEKTPRPVLACDGLRLFLEVFIIRNSKAFCSTFSPRGRATRLPLVRTQACSTLELELELEGAAEMETGMETGDGAEMETSAHEAQTWSLSSQSHLNGQRP